MVNSRLPQWLTKRVPSPQTVELVNGMMRDSKLHTVCESARCPNLGECWSKQTATLFTNPGLDSKFVLVEDTQFWNSGAPAIVTVEEVLNDANFVALNTRRITNAVTTPSVFVEDWYLYHVNEGEVHCGTATKR